MHVLKRIFGFIWACWGAAWFMLVVALLTPVYALLLFVFGKKYSMFCVWINAHYASPFLLWIMGIRLKIVGREKVDPKATYVFVANHLSQIDILATASAMPHPIRFLAKMEIKHIPVFGYMVKMLAIMVDRKSKESREKSVRYMIQELKQGHSIFIYPEGTRNRTEQALKEFKDGAFRVAIEGEIPVAVLTLVGAKEVNSPEGIQLYPGTVYVYWDEPIQTKGMSQNDLPALRERVRSLMMQHLLNTAHE